MAGANTPTGTQARVCALLAPLRAMTPNQLLVALRSRWISAVVVLLGVLAIVATATTAAPRRYTAAASVLLDVKSPDPVAVVAVSGLTLSSSSYVATQADVLRSERVVRGALQRLHLLQDTARRAQWAASTGGRGDFAAWLVEALSRDLEVKPSRDSNVLTVAYTADDPAFAAAMANAIVDAYIGTTVDLRVEPARRFNAFFDERARELRDALEAAQARLSAYQREKGILVEDEKLDVEHARLGELSTQLVSLQAASDESASRRAQAARHAARLPEVVANPLVSGLTAELSRQEAKLGDLQQRYGDRYPEVVQLRAVVGSLRARIGAETQRVGESLAVADDVNHTRLAQLRGALEGQRAKLLQLKGRRDEQRVLLRDVENAQKAYDTMLMRVSQTGIESQATQTNVAVLRQAWPPLQPSTPRVSLNLLGGLVLGALLAMATAIVRERRDQRLRTPDDVTQLLKQPLLGVLPPPRGLLTRKRRPLAMLGMQRRTRSA